MVCSTCWKSGVKQQGDMNLANPDNRSHLLLPSRLKDLSLFISVFPQKRCFTTIWGEKVTLRPHRNSVRFSCGWLHVLVVRSWRCILAKRAATCIQIMCTLRKSLKAGVCLAWNFLKKKQSMVNYDTYWVDIFPALPSSCRAVLPQRCVLLSSWQGERR